jgi:hypothetical protein
MFPLQRELTDFNKGKYLIILENIIQVLQIQVYFCVFNCVVVRYYSINLHNLVLCCESKHL